MPPPPDFEAIGPVSYVNFYGTVFRCLLHYLSTSGDVHNAISLDVLVFERLSCFTVCYLGHVLFVYAYGRL